MMQYLEDRINSDLDFLLENLPADKNNMSKEDAIFLLGYTIGALRYLQRELNIINATEKNKQQSNEKTLKALRESLSKGKTD